ncbi:hypothetical protein V6N13_099681 [Hibiscus sabdariffa]
MFEDDMLQAGDNVSDDSLRVDSAVNCKVVVELFGVLGQQITDSNEVSVDESLVVDVVDYVVELEVKLKSIHSLRKTRNASLGVHRLLQDMK